jgi:NhaP-type Na+/H+ or K+/H+ antiporter
MQAAIMLGAILIVSGPTVVTPILEAARPGKRLTTILGYEPGVFESLAPGEECNGS